MQKEKRITFILVFVATAIILLRIAWLSDDAFITLRTVDNWIHGYGLTFNPPQRVQAYTHPLWMFGMTLFYLVLRNGYFTLILLSLTTSLVAIYLFISRSSEDIFAVLVGWATLMLSKSFVDFSTSGLENPATHLLLFLFITLFLKTEFPVQKSRLFSISLIAGLSTLNRFDSVLFFIPALLYLLYKHRSAYDASVIQPSPPSKKFASAKAGFSLVLAGFSPILIWEIFSIFYYGFFFPNTYYAKLHAGIPQSLLFNQGILYYLNSIAWDPITLLVTFTTLVFAFTQGEAKPRALAMGISLYLLYVLYIGGDFMTGRFFSATLFASVILLVHLSSQLTMQQKYTLAAVFLVFGVLSPRGTFAVFVDRNNKLILDENSGISDEREAYFSRTGLMSMNRSFELPLPSDLASEIEKQGSAKRVAVRGAVGIAGYFGGPQLHIIDVYALSDPLLAHMPINNHYARIGHFERDVPKGYVETLETGQNKIANPKLAEFYDKITFIITGDLFLAGRLKTIWEMNTGQYDYLIEDAAK